MTDPEPLYHDPALARLYDGQNPWSADTDHCLGLARSASSLLDLGCGTGRFCARVAAECAMAVTGTDPAPAMLEIARARPESPRITWVLGDARTVRLGCRFDLIVMTGHAFQTLLTDADRAAGLATSAAHLSPTGRFIFDSRNPSVREWDTWTPDRTRMTFADPTGRPVETWTDASLDPISEIVSYTTHYRLPSSTDIRSARSRLGFVSQPRLAQQIARAGLSVNRWMGEWDGRPYADDAPEIIPVGRLA